MKNLIIWTVLILILGPLPLYGGPLGEIDVALYRVDTNQKDLGGKVIWSNFDQNDPNWEVADQYLVVHYAVIQEEGDPADPFDDVWYDGGDLGYVRIILHKMWSINIQALV